MKRREFLTQTAWTLAAAGGAIATATGCRGRQYGHIVRDDQSDLVGSHTAGAAVFNPLVDEAVAKLLGRQQELIHPASHPSEFGLQPKNVFFAGLENKSAEELNDFRDQLTEQINSKINHASNFQPLSRRFIEAGLHEAQLRPDSLFIPDNMRLFTIALERQGAPVDYLLFATLTSGTTVRNASQQRDYLLSLELVNIHTGHAETESATIRKGYHKTPVHRAWHYNPFKRKA